jgi:hypothetical protein
MPERLFSVTWNVQRAIKEVDSAFAFVNEILSEVRTVNRIVNIITRSSLSCERTTLHQHRKMCVGFEFCQLYGASGIKC